MKSIISTILLLLGFLTYSQAINFDEVVSGEITSIGQENTYTFSADAGDIISFSSVRTGTDLDPEIDILEPGGNQLDQISSFSGSNFIGHVEIINSGTHTIVFRDDNNNETGTYNLNIEKVTPAINAVQIAFNEVMSGEITDLASQDLYTFSANAGDIISFSSVRTGTDIDPEIEVFGPDGRIDDISSFSGSNLIGNLAVVSSGMHTILFRDDNLNEIGTYNLNIEKVSPIQNALPINFNDPVSAEITELGAQDLYSFSATSGDLVSFSAVRTSESLDPEIEIFGPQGRLDDISSFSGSNFIGSVEIQNTGSHVILFRDDNLNELGGYNLNIEKVTPSENAVAISIDDVIEGEIAIRADQDLYVFSATAGQVLSFKGDRRSGSIDPEMELFGPGGRVGDISSFSGSSFDGELTISETGQHTLAFRDDNLNETGRYRLTLFEAITPAFVSDITSIDQGQEVSFTNNSTGDADSYIWFFEGALPSSSTEANPVVTYDIPGTYDVELIAYKNNQEVGRETKSDFITVNPISTLEARIRTNTRNTYQGGSVKFTDISTGNITSRTWSFSGGNISTSTDLVETVRFDNVGTFEVSLEVSDGSSTDTRTILINVIESQNIEFADILLESFYSGANPNYDDFYGFDSNNSAGDSPNVSPNIVLGDNDFCLSLPIGSLVTVAFTDNVIINAPDQDDIFIEEGQGVNEYANVFVSSDNQNFTFLGTAIGSSTGLNNTSTFDLDDIGWNDPVTAIKVIGLDLGGSSPGYDLCSVSGIAGAVEENNQLAALFEADEVKVEPDGSINFSDLSTGTPTTWSWTFEGGTPSTSTEQNPSVAYAAEGSYDVTLTITNGTNSVSRTVPDYITVKDKLDLNGIWLGEGYQCPPGTFFDEQISIVHDLSTGSVIATKIDGDECVPAGEVTFEGTFDGLQQSFSAQFTTGSVSNPTSGTIETTLVFLDDNKINQQGGDGVLFTRQGSIAASFTSNQSTVEVGDSIQFSDNSVGQITSWSWTFEGGTPSSSTEQNPSITYNTVGVFDVSLTVSDGSESDTQTTSSYVEVTEAVSSLTADFSSDVQSLESGQSVQFSDGSSGNPTSWSWTFEGGTPSTSTIQNPIVAYNTAGTYDVTLTVNDGSNSETITEVEYITVTETVLDANFSTSGTSIFVDGQIDFTDESTGNPTSWSWTFEGGTPSSSTLQNPSVTYNTAGIYDVTLTVSDGTDQSVITQTDLITVEESNAVLNLASTIDVDSFGATDADIQDGYVYAVDDGFSADVLKVFDIFNPNNPLEVFSLDFAFELEPNSIIADGDRLIIGGDGGGEGASLVIMDITNPASPVLLASHLTIPRSDGEEARTVTGLRNINGDILYTQSGTFDFMSIDISNPNSPLIIDGFGDNFTGLIFGGIGDFVIQDDNNAWLDNNDFRHASISSNGGITMGPKLDIIGGELYDFKITSQNNIGYAATWQSDAANVITVDFSNQQVNDLYIQDIDSLVGGFGFSAKMELYEARNLLFVSSVVDFLALDISNRNQPVPLEVNEGSSFLKVDDDILITRGFASVINVYSIVGGTVEEVNASFSSDLTNVSEGGEVQFTDNSNGNPTSWNWTFEGGMPSTSTEQNPTVTYANEGIYDVTLSVSNGVDTDEVVQTDYIEVVIEPKADITISEVSVDPITSFPGDDISINVVIANIGNLDLDGNVSVNYYLSEDNILDPNDVNLLSSSITDLIASDSKSLENTLTIPDGTLIGEYSLLVELDPLNLIDESNEENNLSISNISIIDRKPIIVNPLADLNLEQGFGSESIDLSTVFDDPDEDILLFTTSSDNTSAISAFISGQNVVLTEQGIGLAKISVTADDSQDGSVTDEFLVAVNDPNNTIPIVVNAIEDLVLKVGFDTEVLDLASVFTDEDGDNLEFSIEKSDGTSVLSTLDGSSLTLREQEEGITDITISAYDGSGGLATESFSVSVITNNPPIVENPLADLSLDEGFISETISIAEVFVDADGDELILTATSDDEGVVSVSILDTNLILVEQGIGSASITVTADDNNQGVVSDQFVLTIIDINEIPILENPIPDLAFEPGFISSTVQLDTVFADGDGDILTFTVASSDENVVVPSISNSNIILTEVGGGTAIITIVADDGREGVVEDSFNVINLENDLPEIINPIEDQILSQGFVTSSINFENVFTDPDNDHLSFSVVSSNEEILIASITGNNIVFIEQTLGTVEVILTADDSRNGIATDTFSVSVVENNLPIVSNAIVDQVFESGFGSISFDLNNVFSDSDGDNLTFTSNSENESVVVAITSGATLSIIEEGLGETIINVIANDGKGGSATNTFSVGIIEAALGFEEGADIVYPTIVNGVINISSNKIIKQSKLTKLNGSVERVFGDEKSIDTSSIADGIYIVSILFEDGSQANVKVIIKN